MAKDKYTEKEVRQAVAQSVTFADIIRALGKDPVGGNYDTVRRYIEKYSIDVSHINSFVGHRGNYKKEKIPTHKLLVANSSASRSTIKNRIYKEKLLPLECSSCGQGEIWKGRPLSLILDHINGVNNDNRLSNLRLLCPNCNATLDTHCGRNVQGRKKFNHCSVCNKKIKSDDNRRKVCSQKCSSELKRQLASKRKCAVCGELKKNSLGNRKTCSPKCLKTLRTQNGSRKREYMRKVVRPSYSKLKKEIEENGYCATGRKYGVSDNAVRKWLKNYENTKKPNN